MLKNEFSPLYQKQITKRPEWGILRLSYQESRRVYYLNACTSSHILFKSILLVFFQAHYPIVYQMQNAASLVTYSFSLSLERQVGACTSPSPGQMDKLRLFILQDWHLAVKDSLEQLLSAVMWSTLTGHYHLIKFWDYEMFLQT